MAGSVRLTVL